VEKESEMRREKDVVLDIATGRIDSMHLSTAMRDARRAGDWDTCIYCGNPVEEDEDLCEECKAKHRARSFTAILRRGSTEGEINEYFDSLLFE